MTIMSLIFILFSCTQPKSKLAEYGTVFERVVLSDMGVFRGFSLGDSLVAIQTKEVGQPIEKEKDYLYYEYKLDTTGSFNITYDFDEKGLNEIQSDIFINKADETDDVLNKFKAYFDQHYGASETDMGLNVWSVKSEKYGEVKISLSDESAAFTTDKAPGRISLWIYPNKD